VHLSVADVDETVSFYRDELGFDLMAQLGGEAAFLAAGGYHHHLGANTWESRGAPQAPPGTARLRSFTIIVPGAETSEIRQDPSGNMLVLQPGG
jgi:catechol 2,3-dioxygenase